jgi:hypothetical protein
MGSASPTYVMAITKRTFPRRTEPQLHPGGKDMRSGITQLIIGTAVAMSVVAVSAIGSAVAQSPVGQAEVIGQEALTNRYGSPFSETDFRLSDRQQLRGYFLGGSRERFR